MTKIYRLLLFVLFSSPAVAGCHKSQPAANTHKNTAFRTVGYLMIDRSDIANVVSQIDFTSLTHLNLAFINPDSTGAFADNAAIPTIVTTAHANNVKVLMSIAGGDIPPYFTSLLADGKHTGFIKAIVARVAKYSFDGVDVDIEGDNINTNYGKFVTELAAALAPSGKLITSALASWNGSSVPDSAIAAFNFINIMAYDSTGPWAPTHPGQHSSYTFAESDLYYWGVTRKVPQNKMTLGVPFYGYSFGNNAVGTMTFGDIVDSFPGAANEDDYNIHGGFTVFYNGIPTIKSKTQLALKKAGGIMIWELSQDATGNNALLKNIHSVIEGN
jgi:GH18 family chitinase